MFLCIGDDIYWFSNVLVVIVVVDCMFIGNVIVKCVEDGNIIWACWRASLIAFGVGVNFILNPCGVRICMVIGFWIWVAEMTLYTWTLLRCLVVCSFWL